MNTKKIENLLKIKEELCEKYRSQARRTKSAELRRRMTNRAERYRRQSIEIARKLEASS